MVSNKKGEPKPKYPIDLNLYTLTQTPKSFKLPKNILVVNSKTKIAHLVTDASQDLVLEVTIGNKLVEKKLKITQTYDKILNAGNKWPSLRFYSDKTIILRGFALYGPNPVYID